MNLWIAISAIIVISGVLAWGTYMITFRSTGRHSDVPFIQDDDAPWTTIQSMQLHPEKTSIPFRTMDLRSAYPAEFFHSTINDKVTQFYYLMESISEIGIPEGW